MSQATSPPGGRAPSGRPAPGEFASFYSGYVERVPESDVVAVLEAQRGDLARLAGAVPTGREAFAYAPGKWSVREILGHLGDAERVFGFRAFCFSRGDAAPLPGFDEGAYVAASHFAATPVTALTAEWTSLRAANLALLGSLDTGQWTRTGVANGHPISVRALAFAMAGHVRHHLEMLRDRYGIGTGR